MIKLAAPDIHEEDITKAIEVIKSGNLVQGREVAAFELLLSNYTGLAHAVVVTSGTAALHLSLMALGIGVNDFVLVPAFTFPATANAVEVVGASCLFADVDKRSYVMTPAQIEKVIEENEHQNIRAIIVVHEFGFPANIKEIALIAKHYGLHIIEDSACALGTVADGYHVGNYSDLTCFSFHPRKALTTGEGGAAISKNFAIAEKIRSLRNHGMEATNSGLDFTAPGLNYRMTDFQAALAFGQLERFNTELEKRKELVHIYCELLQKEKRILLPEIKAGHSWQSFMVVLHGSLDRKKVIARLREKGIESNLGAQALNCLNYYKKKYKFKEQDFSNARELYDSGLVLPLYGKLRAVDIEYIAKSLLHAVNN